MPFLLTQDQSGLNQRIQIESETVVIGRHPDCQVVIEDSSVSRKHAHIVKVDGNFVLEDLDSRNGTSINNQTVHQPTRLNDGDLIKICDEVFMFHMDAIGTARKPRGTIEHPNLLANGSSITLEDDDEGMSSIMSQIDLQSHQSAVLVSPEKKLNALMNITRTLGVSIDLNVVFPKVLDFVLELFVNADRASIVLADEEGNPKPIAMKIRNPNDDEKIRISRTIFKHVMKTRQALLSSDAAEDERFDLSQSITDFRIRSIMCAPLVDAEQKAIGILQLDTLRRSVAFTDEDLELLVTVAIQSGLAIDNARNHEKVIEQLDVQRDLELANEVQRRLLPARRPKHEDYSFFDYYRPAHHVGGDYFDYIQLDENRTAVIVADVVGHGIAAALLMAKLSAEVRFALATCNTASEAVRNLNSAIEDLNLDRFVTMVLVLLDRNSHQLTVVNAGHMQPIVLRSGGEVFRPDDRLSDVPIGILDSADFPEYTIDVEEGDSVLLYTDGVNESMDRDGKQYGVDRMIDRMKDAEEKTPESITENIISDLKVHIGEESQFDDICVVTFRRG